MEPFVALILLPVLFFLPGYTAVRLLEARKSTDMVLFEKIYLAVALSVLTTTVLGLVLAELSLYSLKNLTLLVLVIGVPLLAYSFIGKRRPAWASERPGRLWTVLLVALIILFLVLSVRGFEEIVAGRDAAPYLIWGSTIEGSGGLEIYNTEIGSLSPDEEKVIYGKELAEGSSLPGGLHVKDPKTGEVGVSYFPFYPVLVAMFLRLVGLKGTLLFMNPFIALLGLLGIVLLCRRLFGKWTALLAGVLLAVNGLTIYFARYPTPEIMALFLVFLGLLCFSLYYDGKNGWWGVLASFSLCMSFTARFDLYYILSPIIIACGLLIAIRLLKRERWTYLLWFMVPIPVFFAHALAGQLIFSRRYFLTNYRGTLGNRLPEIAGATAAIFAFTVLAALLYRHLKERGALERARRLLSRLWRPALVALLVAAGLFAFFIMPLMDRGVTVTTTGKILPSHLEDTFRMIFWYLSPVAFCLFLLGLSVFVLRDLRPRHVMFFVTGLFSAALLTYSCFCTPLHLWVMRRYIIVVVPFILIMAAYALFRTPQVLKARWLYAASAAAFIALIVIFSLFSSLIVPNVEYEGTLAYFERLSEEYRPVEKKGVIGPGPVLLFMARPGDVYFPDPSRYLFDMDSLPCMATEQNADVLGGLVDRWTGEGRKVYLIDNSDRLPRLWPACWPVYQKSDLFGYRHLELVYDRKPDREEYDYFEMETYRLLRQMPDDGYKVEIGRMDDTQYIAYGFYEPYAYKGEQVRWTKEKAGLVLPVLPGRPDMEVTLVMGLGPRVGEQQSAPVGVSLDGKPVFQTVVSSEGFKEYRFKIRNSDLADPGEASMTMELTVPGWRPGKTSQQVGEGPFGITLDRVKVSAAAPEEGLK